MPDMLRGRLACDLPGIMEACSIKDFLKRNGYTYLSNLKDYNAINNNLLLPIATDIRYDSSCWISEVWRRDNWFLAESHPSSEDNRYHVAVFNIETKLWHCLVFPVFMIKKWIL